MTGANPGTAAGSHPQDPSRAAGAARPCVLYVVGSGRSGSTLLERLVGGIEGFVNVGELIELFRWVAPEDERCGCGEPFSRCPFWTEVGRRAVGGWTPDLLARVAGLQRRVARQRRLPQLLVHPGGRAMAADLAEYQDLYARIYAAVVEVAGARVVVDASKWPAQALALARAPQLDVRLLHLVRDARGVAFSWAKSGVLRPHAETGRTTMAVHPVGRTATRWSAFQVEAELVGRVAERYHRLRYEDLIADPGPSLRLALAQLGLDPGPGATGHVDGAVATLGPSHGIGGNPSRFRHGPQPLRLDEEWRRAMPTRDRRLTTSVTGALLARYGYLHARSDA